MLFLLYFYVFGIKKLIECVKKCNSNTSSRAIHTKQWVMPCSEKCAVTSVSTSQRFSFHIALSKFMLYQLELHCLEDFGQLSFVVVMGLHLLSHCSRKLELEAHTLLKYYLCTAFAQTCYSCLSYKHASLVQQVLKLKPDSFSLKIPLSTSQVALPRDGLTGNTKQMNLCYIKRRECLVTNLGGGSLSVLCLEHVYLCPAARILNFIC